MKEINKIPGGEIFNTWLLNRAVGGGGFKSPSLNSLATVFIRKVDLAAYEFAVARYNWLTHGTQRESGGGVFFTLPAAGDHLELCILSLRRAIRCLDRLRQSKDFPQIDRLLKKRIDHAGNDLVQIRNTIEHVDEEIAHGLEMDEPNTLLITADGKFASISDATIEIEAIHRCISLLQDVAVPLSSHREA